MLNRTHQTTSANTNRHDLGTRQLATLARTNMGPKSLRTRHAHPQVVVETPRAGILRGLESPESSGYPRPGTPGSSFQPAWPGLSDRPSRSLPAFKDPMSVVVTDDRPRRSGVQARASRAEVALAGTLAEG